MASENAELPLPVPETAADAPPAEQEATVDEPLQFAPNQRYGWPEDFLLPLVIEIEIPEVPEAIRGPSPPIEASAP